MEEILCSGCGATIQTTDKDWSWFHPQSALEKGLETGESIANAVSVSVITMKLQMSS